MMMKLGILAVVVALTAYDGSHAISGGSPTFIENHPYQVAIDQYNKQTCGGALITTMSVITAASCFRENINASDITIRLGSQLRQGSGRTYGLHKMVTYASPPNGDLIMLYLDTQVLSNRYKAVNPIDMARPGSVKQGQNLLITGYGDVNDDGDSLGGVDQQLRAATVRAFDLILCRKLYRASVHPYPNACAGGMDSGMCGTRDVGTPLVDWQARLVGVALGSAGCGHRGLPTVYTDVTETNLHRWIQVNWKWRHGDFPLVPPDYDNETVIPGYAH